MGIALGIDFSWIFSDHESQVEAKLAASIDKNRSEKLPEIHLDSSSKHLEAVLAPVACKLLPAVVSVPAGPPKADFGRF